LKNLISSIYIKSENLGGGVKKGTGK